MMVDHLMMVKENKNSHVYIYIGDCEFFVLFRDDNSLYRWNSDGDVPYDTVPDNDNDLCRLIIDGVDML